MNFDDYLEAPYRAADRAESRHEAAIEDAREEIESGYLVGLDAMRGLIEISARGEGYLGEWVLARIEDGLSFCEGDPTLDTVTDAQLETIRTLIRKWMREDGFCSMVSERADDMEAGR
jgi:hypothetical protein